MGRSSPGAVWDALLLLESLVFTLEAGTTLFDPVLRMLLGVSAAMIVFGPRRFSAPTVLALLAASFAFSFGMPLPQEFLRPALPSSGISWFGCGTSVLSVVVFTMSFRLFPIFLTVGDSLGDSLIELKLLFEAALPFVVDGVSCLFGVACTRNPIVELGNRDDMCLTKLKLVLGSSCTDI